MEDYNSKYLNNYPVILVHGFGGWGKDELLGYKYWGGLSDLEAYLNSKGHQTFSAAIGPFSSNWDRACELYAFIKGGTVDYGEAHSKKYGHSRYGRTYEGVYPEWGKLDPKTGLKKKVHLIGHSMGGQTIRVLAQLLEKGCSEEIELNTASLSPLFSSQCKDYICSITSISTPHDGTTLANTTQKILPFAQQLLATVATLGSWQSFYDFKLDHWGLVRDNNESLQQYFEKVWSSHIWSNNEDISTYDLNCEGAQKLNQWVKAQPNIYYFSIITTSTESDVITNIHHPKIKMNPLLWPFAAAMGISKDPMWRENDGAVNTISMNGPKLGSTDEIILYNGQPQIGKWNVIKPQESWDHLAIIGQGIKPIGKLFRKHIELLKSL